MRNELHVLFKTLPPDRNVSESASGNVLYRNTACQSLCPSSWCCFDNSADIRERCLAIFNLLVLFSIMFYFRLAFDTMHSAYELSHLGQGFENVVFNVSHRLCELVEALSKVQAAGIIVLSGLAPPTVVSFGSKDRGILTHLKTRPVLAGIMQRVKYGL